MQDAGVDWNLLGGLERALHLVHCRDALRFFAADEVDVGGNVPRPLSAASIAQKDRLMQRRCDTGVTKPCGDIADGGAISVVEVMTRGEELDGLSSPFMESIE